MLHLLLAAAVAAPIAVPESLKPWVSWALKGHEDIECPLVFGVTGGTAGGATDRQCLWPSKLSLRVEEREGRFTEEVTSALATDDLAPLPGGDRHWPLDVTVDGRPALVVEGDPGPRVIVARGSHTIAGRFLWDSPPDSIKVPADLGLLDLVLAGKPVATPDWSAGELNLTRQGKPEEEENRLVAIVSRKLDDGVPFQVLTHIELSIAGKSRDELLGPALLPGTFPVSIDSRLPVRLQPDGRLRVQARQGTWTIDLLAYVNASVASLTLPRATEGWPAEEVWVFQAEPALRDVELSGLPQVDPQQTRLPDDWKSLPAYRATPGATLALGERRRGDPNPPPDDLHLDRTLWLDFDGHGYTLHDRLYGQLHQSWRLDLAAPAELGHVRVGERDQLITRGPKGGAGFEVREGGLSAEADSRLAGEPTALPAVGWDHDVKSLSATLNLPPGWRLFNAPGVDHVDGGFVAQWTLLDLFLLLVISAAIGQLLGAEAGLLSLCALGLTFHEPDAPQWLWLLLVALEALRRIVKSGPFSRVIGVARLGAVALLAFALVQFAIGQLRAAFYPTLAQRQEASWSLSRSAEPAAVGEAASGQAAPAEIPEDFDGAKDALHAFGAGGAPPAAAAPKMPAGSHRIVKEGKMGKLKLGGLSTLIPPSAYGDRDATAPNWTSEVDPTAIVQTGPGLPTWSWTSVRLSWSGPVPTGQAFRLWLIPPPVERALNVLRVALTLLLCFLILGLPLAGVLAWLRGRRPALGALAFLVCFAASAARADYPDPALLTQLGDRLAELPKCQPKCGALNRLVLTATATELRLGLSVSAAAPLALPLPQSPQWRAAQVTVDGRPAPVVRRDDGQLWVAVATGVHQILEVGPLAGRDVVQLNLPLEPRFTGAQLGGWTLLGLHEDGDADDDLQLSRSAPETQSEKAGGQRPETLPPFALVERQLTLGLNWTVQTTVRRQGPQGPTASPVVLEVPLLPGESVVSGDTRVTGGKAQVSLAPGQDQAVFSGKLPETKALILTAPKDVPWNEVWYVDVSPLWHLETKGIPEIHAQDSQGARRPEWHPWPGEQVTLDISRPAALPGQSVTIDRSSLSVTPGLRQTEVELRYTARASRGDQQHLSLPAGAKVEALDVSGQSLPVPREGAALDVPLKPGQQEVHVRFTQNAGIEVAYQTPAVDLGTPSVNTDLTLQLPSDRWVLWLRGPAVGPAVLLWGELLALLIVAIVAARLRLVPLGIGGWFLLGLGFTQDETPLLVGAAVVGFLLILGVRREHHPSRPFLFNLTQILLAGLALLAGACLLFIVRNGLLTFPQMGIDGVGSSAANLHWFADRTAGPLAQAFVLSAPLWVYRLAMLGWSLWLALTCVRLAPWAFGAFSAGGIFKRRPPAAAGSASAGP